jgi:hypothetical protein
MAGWENHPSILSPGVVQNEFWSIDVSRYSSSGFGDAFEEVRRFAGCGSFILSPSWVQNLFTTEDTESTEEYQVAPLILAK